MGYFSLFFLICWNEKKQQQLLEKTHLDEVRLWEKVIKTLKWKKKKKKKMMMMMKDEFGDMCEEDILLVDKT